MINKLLKSKQAAEYLSVSERTLWNLQRELKIRAVRMGRLIRFDPDDLDDFIQRSKTSIA